MAGIRRRWTAVDRGMLHLVRLVLDDAWHPIRAGTKLRDVIADQQVLRQMATRVRRTLADRPSIVGERAARTLEVAIGPGSAQSYLTS